MKVSGHQCPLEEIEARLAHAASRMRTVTEYQLQRVSVVSHILIQREFLAADEAHPLVKAEPVVCFHGIIESSNEIHTRELAENHKTKKIWKSKMRQLQFVNEFVNKAC